MIEMPSIYVVAALVAVVVVDLLQRRGRGLDNKLRLFTVLLAGLTARSLCFS